MAIEIALIGGSEITLCTNQFGRAKGTFPASYRGKDIPIAEYLENEDSLVWLSDGCYLLPEIIQFLKENPRPAHREVYPRVEVYDDDTYWGEQGYKTKPLKVLKDVNLLELLEALKEFAPEYAR